MGRAHRRRDSPARGGGVNSTAWPRAARALESIAPVRVLREASIAWVFLAVGAVTNGILREAVLLPWLGERVARVLSISILLGLIIGVSSWLVRSRWSALSTRALVAIGASWAIMSALFEFGLGRLVLDMRWSELLAAYDLLAGEYWILAPLAMLTAPAIARAVMRRRAG